MPNTISGVRTGLLAMRRGAEFDGGNYELAIATKPTGELTSITFSGRYLVTEAGLELNDYLLATEAYKQAHTKTASPYWVPAYPSPAQLQKLSQECGKDRCECRC